MQQVRQLPFQFRNRFLVILAAFSLLFFISWPIVFSFDLWVLKDRGSFLNLDRLLAQHLRLGVDTYYSYGLLPVFIQHVLFAAFGRGYWPMIGCTVVTMIFMAAFWALLLRRMTGKEIWLIAVILLSPLLFWVNPNFPYSLVILSILFALYFVLENRFGIASTIAAAGCFSVPSLPLVLLGCLFLAIFIRWWQQSDRSPGRLIRSLAPGFAAYLSIALFLTAIFGWRSVAATALPFAGMRYYKTVHFDSLATSIEFLHPPGHSPLYYLGYSIATPVTWWLLSSVVLFFFGVWALYRMICRKRLEPQKTFIVLCAILQAVFAFFARGPVGQYVIYDPVPVAGVLLGIHALFSDKWRKRLLFAFLCLGVAGETQQARTTFLAWKNTRVSNDTAGLYAAPAWTAEWSHILELSRHQKLLLLSYGTGATQYFPTIESPDTWFLRTGQLFPADQQRLLLKMKNADVIAEDLTGLTSYMDKNPQVQRELYTMCMTESTAYFKVWWRDPSAGGTNSCIAGSRRR